MTEAALFIYGLLLVFFTGSLVMWRHMSKQKEKHIYVSKEDAIELIETDEQIKKLKKELHL